MHILKRIITILLLSAALISCSSGPERKEQDSKENHSTKEQLSDTKTSIYKVGTESSFRLSFPNEWEEEVKEDKRGNRVISFKDGSGEKSFTIYIRAEEGGKERGELEYNLQMSGRELLKYAKEEYLQLHEFNTDNLGGYYYSLTDRGYNPEKAKADSYPCITNCSLSGGDITYTITILTHSLEDGLIESLLSIFRSIE